MYDFRYAKIAKISKLNYFFSIEYFFLKLYIQTVLMRSLRFYEFMKFVQKLRLLDRLSENGPKMKSNLKF